MAEIARKRPTQAAARNRDIDFDRLVWDQEYRLEVARNLTQEHEQE